MAGNTGGGLGSGCAETVAATVPSRIDSGGTRIRDVTHTNND